MKKLIFGAVILLNLLSCQLIKEIQPIPIFPITLNFYSGNHINKDARLSVDIIIVEDSDAILEIGPEDWFGDDKRGTLLKGEQLYKLSFLGNQTQKQKVKVKSSISRIIIFAEYDNSLDREDQQLVLEPKTWNLNYTILLKDNHMELTDDPPPKQKKDPKTNPEESGGKWKI